MKLSIARTVSIVAALSLAVGVVGAAAIPASAAISAPEQAPDYRQPPIAIGENKQGVKSADSSSYSATGSLSIAFFWNRVSLDVAGGKRFVGNGGVTQPFGGGWFSGTLQTDDIDALYKNTVRYNINGALAYLNINFFDANSNLLGTLHSGSVSNFLGTGGGDGSWS